MSKGCEACYAEAFARRYGKAQWGPTALRVRTSLDYWRKPYQWNRKALAEGRRMKVFCASLADVFEDNAQVVDWRLSLFGVIQDTPALDWLLLTKRPENINDMVPGAWRNVNRWPANVWIGTSVENQEMADRRIPELLRVPARVRFLSCEPLLGPVDLSFVLDWNKRINNEALHWHENPIHWVIVGGESGPKARPMHLDWVRSLRDECVDADVPFFYKQIGNMNSGGMRRKDGHYRELDGRTWDEYPAVTSCS